MSQQQHLSEVAQLREQIELECRALTMLRNKPATVAQHRVITNRFRNLDAPYEALEKLVGSDEANDIVLSIYDQEVQ